MLEQRSRDAGVREQGVTMARRIRWIGVLALALVSTGANSLGLGDIKLNSYLNERLDAEIRVSLSGADELNTLRVEIAPRAEFDRVGIDRPLFLDGLDFVVERTSGDSAIIRVTSDQPMVEPFVTFLIEARWSGGRLLREYTVLLDPPLFLPTPEPPAVDAPVPARDSAASGMVQRPAPTPAPRVAPQPTVSPPGVYGPVRRAETLWSIAQEVRPDPGISVNQMMVALFNANPDAFDGNINRMRAGARLRVPSRDEILGTSPAQATAEVRSQNTRWRSSTPRAAGAVAAGSAPSATTSDEPRLELVPPEDVDTGAAAAAGAPLASEQAALNQELLNAVQSLRSELEETRQAIGIKDAEIAALQERLALIDGGQAVAPELEAEFDPDSVDRAIAEAEAEAAVEAAAEGIEGAVEEEAAGTPVVEAAPPATPAPIQTPPPAQVSGSPQGGLFSSIWVWIAGFAALLAALFFVWKKRQEAETEEAFEAWEAPAEPIKPEPVSHAETSPAILVEEQTHPGTEARAAAGVAADAGLDFDVTEAAVPAAKAEPEPEPEPEPQEAARPAPVDEPTGTDYQYPFEDTIAGATGINLQQSDPLAEADFHMAYGLYDQAADLIRKASGREPDRVDLRLKMLDILFVWGKGDEFVSEAKALQDLGSAEASEWSRVAIMGRQIAPEQGLFEEQGGGHAAVDVALTEDGEGKPDIDLAGSSDDLDLDFGAGKPGEADQSDDALDFDIGATGEMPAPAPWDATQEREVMPDATAEMEIEDLGLDVNLEDLEESTRGPDELDLEGTGMTEIIVRDDDSRFTDSVSDTEVLKDFEHGDTGVLDEGSGDTEVLEKPSVDEDDETGITEMLETAEDMANDVSGAYSVEELEERKLDEVTREMAQLSEDGEGDTGGTSEMEVPDIETEGDTAEVEALEEPEDGDLDLEDITAALGRDLEQTAEMPVAGATADADTLIADIFGDEDETRVAPRSDVLGDREDDAAATREMPQIENPDVTLSEVGTKLDLARAYIDMGDPDGARSILDEVMEEGDEGQQGEARDLLDGLG